MQQKRMNLPSCLSSALLRVVTLWQLHGWMTDVRHAAARRPEPPARPQPAGVPQHRDRAGAGPAGAAGADRADRAQPARLRRPGGRRARPAGRADAPAGPGPQRLPEADRRRVQPNSNLTPDMNPNLADGALGPLAALTRLQALDLSGCQKLTGAGCSPARRNRGNL